MFYKYFLEIKNRVLLIVYAWFFCMITCYFYKNVLLFLLIKINFKLYNLELFYFITTNVSDVFSVCLRLSYFINYHFIFILITYHFFTFLSSGLFKSEYYLFKSVIFISYFFFIISIVFLHLSILPVLWDFFLILQTKCDINIFFESKITEYLNFYIEIYFLMILISQIFVIIVIKLILVKKKKFLFLSLENLYI